MSGALDLGEGSLSALRGLAEHHLPVSREAKMLEMPPAFRHFWFRSGSRATGLAVFHGYPEVAMDHGGARVALRF